MAVTVAVSGCTVYDRGPYAPPRPVQTRETTEIVYVERDPPPDRSESEGPPPSAEHQRIPGHWRWDGRDWDWVPGHWDRRPDDRADWSPGHWEKHPKGHVWREGHWDHKNKK